MSSQRSFQNITSLALLFAGLWLHPCPAALSGQQTSARPWTADFVAGEGAGTLITDNAAFKDRVRRALDGGNVSFFPTPLAGDQVLDSITRSDLFFFSGHTFEKLDPPMHAVQVGSGLPGKGAKLTSVDIRKHLAASSTRPRLVILVGCQTTNEDDGVPEAFRLSSAFGIHEQTRGRAFLGYETIVVGATADATMARLLEFWCQPGTDGFWPTLAEAVAHVQSPVRIVGDERLRYRPRLGFRKGDTLSLDPRFGDSEYATEFVVDDELPGKPDDLPANTITGIWSTYPKIDGLNYFQCTITRWEKPEDARSCMEKAARNCEEAKASQERNKAHYQVEGRNQNTADLVAVNESVAMSDGKPMHSMDECTVIYRDHFIIEVKRSRDGVPADFTAERMTVLDRARELIDARWPR